MKNRVPQYPGRVILTPVPGQANTYDLTRADAPTEAGDPLNKETFFTDRTAGLYPGLDGDSTPNDAFAFLGGYTQWRWIRRTVSGDSYGAWQEVRASTEDAYPKSGTSGGYQYAFLGMPLENAASSVKIATGSYVGDGTCGEDHKTQVTVEFIPKILIVNGVWGRPNATGTGTGVLVPGSNYVPFSYSVNTDTVRAEVVGTMFRFWSNSTFGSSYQSYNGAQQANQAGQTYTWIAIG